MKKFWTKDEFTKAVIARGNDPDACYDNCGWVAVVDGDDAALGMFYHCSCYGTFTGLMPDGDREYYSEGTLAFTWEGTVEEVLNMARVKADPSMPLRTADPKDAYYVQLLDCYGQILKWAQENGK